MPVLLICKEEHRFTSYVYGKAFRVSNGDKTGPVAERTQSHGSDTDIDPDIVSATKNPSFRHEILGEHSFKSQNHSFGYQGQFTEKDEEMGYNQFELRLYDKRIGRWISPDPKRIEHSFYAGMGNNPISLVDPDGGNPWDWLKYQYYKIQPGHIKNNPGHESYHNQQPYVVYWGVAKMDK